MISNAKNTGIEDDHLHNTFVWVPEKTDSKHPLCLAGQAKHLSNRQLPNAKLR